MKSLDSGNYASPLLNIFLVHEPKDYSEVEQLIERDDVSLILITFDSDLSSKDRTKGHKTPKLLALNKKILLKEYPVDTFNQQHRTEFICTVQNLIIYLNNGGAKSQNCQLIKTWNRYLHSNTYMKLYQRLFTKHNVLRGKPSKAVSLDYEEMYENVPVSFQNFSMKKELDYDMRQRTKE